MARKMSTAPLTTYNETKTSQPQNRPRGPTPKDANGFQKVWDGYKWIERDTVNIDLFIHSREQDTPPLPPDPSPPSPSPLSRDPKVEETATESDRTTVATEASDNESEWEEEIGPCGCLHDGCMKCGCAEEAVYVTAQPKLPLPRPLAAVKVIEQVESRALEYLRRVSEHGYSAMCKPGMTKKEVTQRYGELQAFLNATSSATNAREYTVDKKQAPTRLFCHKSVQGLSRTVRALLVGDITLDFDMVNAAPCALRFICRCFGEEAPYLESYCKQRERKWGRLREAHSMSEKAAKKLFIRAVNDNKQVAKVKVGGEWVRIKDPFFKAFDAEMKHLQRRLMLRPELEWALGYAREDRGNKEGSFMAFLTQWIEGHCLLAAMRVAERCGLTVSVLMFDGFHAMKRDDVDVESVCEALRVECERSLPGIGMHWTVKEPDYSVYDGDKKPMGEVRVPDVLPPPREEENGGGEGSKDAREAAFLFMARDFDLTHFRVDCDYVDEYWKETFTVCDIEKMKKRYVDWLFYYEAKTKDGEGTYEVKERFIDEWLYRYDGKKVYKEFDQIPHTLTCPDDVYNTWIPWPCLKPVDAPEERLVFVLSRALKHLKVMAGNDWDAFEFNLKFYAQAMQYPHIKGAVAIIYFGAEGTGKSTWMKLMRKMFGKAFYSTTRPEETIWGKFNAQAEGKFMLELSETDRSNMHDFWGRVNGFIAEEHQEVRRMRTDAYETKNYTRVLGTTNNAVAVKPGRRYAVCESSNELKFHEMRRKQDAHKGKYACGCECDRCKRLVAYHSEMNNDIMIAPETAYIVGAFFSAYELPPNCAITVQDIPRTEALETIREGCTKQEERFLRYLTMRDPGDLSDQFPEMEKEETSEYTAEVLYDEFQSWQKDREAHIVHIRSQDELVQKIGHLRKDIANCG